MKTSLRIIAMLMALALLTGMLAGCESTSEDTSDSTADTTASEDSSAEDESETETDAEAETDEETKPEADAAEETEDVIGEITAISSTYVTLNVYEAAEEVTDYTALDPDTLTSAGRAETITLEEDVSYHTISEGALVEADADSIAAGDMIAVTTDETGAQQIILLKQAEDADASDSTATDDSTTDDTAATDDTGTTDDTAATDDTGTTDDTAE